jgi:hypothetical protein
MRSAAFAAMTMIAGCTAPAAPTAKVAAPSPPPPAVHLAPLRVRPAFSTLQYSGWAGASIWEGLLAHGWTADSSLFVHCRAADWLPKRFTRGCFLIDPARNKIARTLVSTEDYGGGHGLRDASLAKELEPLGFPAKPGMLREGDAVSLVWEAKGDGPNELDFFLENDATKKRAPLESFRGTHVFPRDAQMSPDGRYLALIVSVVDGPPMGTLSSVIAVEPALKSLLP